MFDYVSEKFRQPQPLAKQNRGIPGITGGGRADRNRRPAHRPYQAGLHHPAAAEPRCGGAGQSQGV